MSPPLRSGFCPVTYAPTADCLAATASVPLFLDFRCRANLDDTALQSHYGGPQCLSGSQCSCCCLPACRSAVARRMRTSIQSLLILTPLRRSYLRRSSPRPIPPPELTTRKSTSIQGRPT